GVLAKMEQVGEECWIQILASPIDDAWHEQGHSYIDAVKGGAKRDWGSRAADVFLQVPIYILSNLVLALFAPPTAADKKVAEKKELSVGQQAVMKAVEEKSAKLGYQVKIRIAYLGPDDASSNPRMEAIVGGFKKFNSTNVPPLTTTKMYNSQELIEDNQ